MEAAPKGVTKGSSKRKSKGKDDRPLKKGSALPAGDKPKKSPPPKPSYGAGKGLMTTTGLVTQGTVCRLLTHKEYAVKMVESIIKDMDPCAEQMTKELGALGLFDLSRVRPFLKFSFTVVHSLANGCLIFKRWCI